MSMLPSYSVYFNGSGDGSEDQRIRCCDFCSATEYLVNNSILEYKNQVYPLLKPASYKSSCRDGYITSISNSTIP